MALADVDRILQALSGLQAWQANKNQLAQRATEQQNLDEREKERIKIEQDRTNETARQHKEQMALEQAHLAATKAAHKVAALHTLQQIGKGYMQGEAPMPAGFEPAGERTSPEGEIYQRFTVPSEFGEPTQTQVPGIIGQIPIPQTMEALSPQSYQKRSADYNEALEKPKRITQALREADLAKAQQTLAKQNRDALASEGNLNRLSRENIGRAHDAALLQREKLKKSNNPFDPTPYIDSAMEGRASLNEIKKQVPDKNNFQIVSSGVKAQGGEFLTDKQKDALTVFTPGVNALRLIHEFNEDQGDGIVTDERLPLSKKHSLMLQKQKQIKDDLAGLANAFQIRGIASKYRIETIADAFAPSVYSYPATNHQKEKNLREYMAESLDAQLANLPQKARDHFKGLVFGATAVPASAGRPSLEDLYRKHNE